MHMQTTEAFKDNFCITSSLLMAQSPPLADLAWVLMTAPRFPGSKKEVG